MQPFALRRALHPELSWSIRHEAECDGFPCSHLRALDFEFWDGQSVCPFFGVQLNGHPISASDLYPVWMKPSDQAPTMPGDDSLAEVSVDVDLHLIRDGPGADRQE